MILVVSFMLIIAVLHVIATGGLHILQTYFTSSKIYRNTQRIYIVSQYITIFPTSNYLIPSNRVKRGQIVLRMPEVGRRMIWFFLFGCQQITKNN